MIAPVRILFSSTWGVGHVFPMVPLARALVDLGHDVMWVGHEPACAHVAAAGLRTRAAGLDAAGVQAVVARNRSETVTMPSEGHAAYTFPRMFGLEATPAMLGDLLSFSRRWKPGLMIHEPAELAAPLVAALMGIRLVTHAWGAPVPPAILAAAADALAPYWSEHGLAVAPFAGEFKDGYLHLCPPSMQFITTDHVSSTVLPLKPEGYSGEESGLQLDDDARPLVYVTLGTVFSNPVAQQAAIDGALDCDARVIVTVGPQGDPAALDTRGGPVKIARWIPQTQVLEKAALLVSHAGSGSFLGALRVGIPQLCLPQAADQFRNSDSLSRTGAGTTLRPREVTATSVQAAIRLLLTDAGPRQAAQRVAAEIAAMPTAATTAQILTR
jgi:UDP:flavonoid glycosyltransferase YjiC (YdhE family)